MKTDELLKQTAEMPNESSVSFAEKDFESGAKAKDVFTALKNRLVQIDEWNAHSLLSTYALFDAGGNRLEGGTLAAGLFIRIALKGSGKYDWIRIANIHEATDEFIITVKPTFAVSDKKRDEKTISHFFTDESTNNFCIRKRDESVGFYVIGLGEKMNTRETGGALETVRNVAVNLGTYLGVQKSEWEKFCHHFLADAADENQTVNEK